MLQLPGWTGGVGAAMVEVAAGSCENLKPATPNFQLVQRALSTRVLMLFHMLPVEPPTDWMAPKIASTIPAMINPYSTTVAPRRQATRRPSSGKRLRMRKSYDRSVNE